MKWPAPETHSTFHSGLHTHLSNTDPPTTPPPKCCPTSAVKKKTPKLLITHMFSFRDFFKIPIILTIREKLKISAKFPSVTFNTCPFASDAFLSYFPSPLPIKVLFVSRVRKIKVVMSNSKWSPAASSLVFGFFLGWEGVVTIKVFLNHFQILKTPTKYGHWN